MRGRKIWLSIAALPAVATIALTAGIWSTAGPVSAGGSGIILSIDANTANGACTTIDATATVALGATHSVAVCISNYDQANVSPSAIDLTVLFSNGLNDPPELDCAAEQAGTQCRNDNPNLNDGASGVGTGWDCSGFGVFEPVGDDPSTPGGDSKMVCTAALANPNTVLSADPGLLATITYAALQVNGDDVMTFGDTSGFNLRNRTTGAADTGYRCVGAADPAKDLVCTGATITKGTGGTAPPTATHTPTQDPSIPTNTPTRTNTPGPRSTPGQPRSATPTEDPRTATPVPGGGEEPPPPPPPPPPPTATRPGGGTGPGGLIPPDTGSGSAGSGSGGLAALSVAAALAIAGAAVGGGAWRWQRQRRRS
jgi:hypothetical protein